jgi:glycerate kinase
MTASRTVVLAPDSFKGTIRARDAAAAIAAGWSAVRPGDRVVQVPMADGGEGTLDAFECAVPGAETIPVVVPGPAGVDVQASWLRLPDGTGVVELASTSGIELIAGDLRPLDAGTAGFGVAIRSALDAGVSRLVLAVGSSASSDGGAGLLQALGARILDGAGEPIAPGARGLESVATVDLSGLAPLPPGGAVVLADVDAPLTGPHGAAAVFGPQKGATPDDVSRIEAALSRWAGLAGFDPATPGAGAAGGAGYALLAWGATLTPGAATVAQLVGLPAALTDAALVITGEGSFDAQSARGKAPGAVLDAARAAGVPVAIVAGRVAVEPDGVRTVDLAALAGGADAAMGDPVRWLREAGRRLAGFGLPPR